VRATVNLCRETRLYYFSQPKSEFSSLNLVNDSLVISDFNKGDLGIQKILPRFTRQLEIPEWDKPRASSGLRF